MQEYGVNKVMDIKEILDNLKPATWEQIIKETGYIDIEEYILKRIKEFKDKIPGEYVGTIEYYPYKHFTQSDEIYDIFMDWWKSKFGYGSLSYDDELVIVDTEEKQLLIWGLSLLSEKEVDMLWGDER